MDHQTQLNICEFAIGVINSGNKGGIIHSSQNSVVTLVDFMVGNVNADSDGGVIYGSHNTTMTLDNFDFIMLIVVAKAAQYI